MFDRLNLIVRQYADLNKKLMGNITDIKELTTLSKEVKGLEKTVIKYQEYQKLESEIKSTKEIIKNEEDLEIIEMAKNELDVLVLKKEAIYEELKVLLLPKDPNDDKNVIVEIKGAAGGDEGNIFAGDLFRMYARYAETRGWKVEILNLMEGSMGGFTNLEFMVSGDYVYSFLKYESGVHRVQRVPETESQGRIHTSTAVVLVMPEVEELEIDIKWEDIRFDTFNSSGPGGQSVNTTKSAVRLTHIPTGVMVACQEGKSQHENRDKAFRLLKTRIYDKFLQEKLQKEGAKRKELIGSGDRSEKIRTYNYPQNRVTDHRIGLTIQRLDAIIAGKLELVVEPLINEFQKRQLAGEIK